MATPALAIQNFFSTTLSSGITASDTTIPLNSLPTGTEGFLIIEPDNSSNREIIYYTSKTGSAVLCPSVGAGRGQDGTTATSHSSGATVKMTVVAGHFNALEDGSAMGHTFANVGSSAVNKFTFSNAITANGPELQATGTDTNIDIELIPKGTGKLKVNGNTISDGAFTVWTPTLTGWSANPSGGIYYYNVIGKECTLTISQPNNGTSNATTCTFTLPFTAVTRSGARWSAACEIVDNGVAQTAAGFAFITSAGTTVTVAKDWAFNAFTTSGNKRVSSLVIKYEIA